MKIVLKGNEDSIEIKINEMFRRAGKIKKIRRKKKIKKWLKGLLTKKK